MNYPVLGCIAFPNSSGALNPLMVRHEPRGLCGHDSRGFHGLVDRSVNTHDRTQRTMDSLRLTVCERGHERLTPSLHIELYP
jgi:hypothetical protein